VPKKEGDISSVFTSLNGAKSQPLPPRFAALKSQLIAGHEDAVNASFKRLLSTLRSEIKTIAQAGSTIVPEIDFEDIGNHSRVQAFEKGLKKRGVAVIRGVVSEEEALKWKEEVTDYVRRNPQTKAFPPNDPQVYELYWSPGQIKARAHPNMLVTQSFLMSFWNSKDKDALLSAKYPLAYADRLRIRRGGDKGFALGPHVDGGSVERWEPDGYGKGGVYDKVWQGKWEEFDSWESSTRLGAISDLYNGAGACSMFRMYQGWLSMSHTAPGEGTLKVNPLLQIATAYYLLRPFFTPKETSGPEFLEEDNWKMDMDQSSALQGAVPACCMELNRVLHPHLDLEKTMVHVPKVRPGDYVAWHCDTIHAVDKEHKGTTDSSVMYIPACPMTEANVRYLKRQREAFLNGTPGPDFPGGIGESAHDGRPTSKDMKAWGHGKGIEAMQAMGLVSWDVSKAASPMEESLLKVANRILG